MSRRDPYGQFTNNGGYGQPYGEEPEQNAEFGRGQEDEEWLDQSYEQPYEQAHEQPYNQPYEQSYEQSYDPSYEQPHEQPYEQPYEPRYQERGVPYSRRESRKAAVISTNATVNLICTICAGCGLFGLFLYFVDQRNRAVRRCAVQSAGLLCVTVFLSAGSAVLATLFGMIPFIGGLLGALAWILLATVLCGDMYLRVRLMAHAYRGEAYVLPLIGRQCRQFE